MASRDISQDHASRKILWLRMPQQRSVVAAHLRHVAGRFRAAGWWVAWGAGESIEPGCTLAVMDDPWVEALPEVAGALARAEADDECWRVPRINGVDPPQGWRAETGPYTARDYELQALDGGASTRAVSPGAQPWCGFAVAAPEDVEHLLAAGWPPEPSAVRLVTGVRLYRYQDPAAHGREELDPYLPDDATTLVDVGCGHGLLGERHRRPGRRVIGIEPDWHLAAVASRRLDLVLAATAEEGLAALRPGVDCIVFADVLEHLVDPRAALAAAARVLADGGCIVTSLPNAAWAPVVRALAAGRWDPTLAGVQARDHLALMTPASFRRQAAECGLRVAHEEAMIAPLSWRQRLFAWIAATLAGGRPKDLLTTQWIAVLERS
ncbi:MAG: methyltransferase domain-containing protein [Acidobacteriota bacterium]